MVASIYPKRRNDIVPFEASTLGETHGNIFIICYTREPHTFDEAVGGGLQEGIKKKQCLNRQVQGVYLIKNMIRVLRISTRL